MSVTRNPPPPRWAGDPDTPVGATCPSCPIARGGRVASLPCTSVPRTFPSTSPEAGVSGPLAFPGLGGGLLRPEPAVPPEPERDQHQPRPHRDEPGSERVGDPVGFDARHRQRRSRG